MTPSPANIIPCLTLLLTLFVTIDIKAQEKTFIKEYNYKASEMDSKISSRAIALNEIRSMLLNEIGVYVKSESTLTTTEAGGGFSQDFAEKITTITAGIAKLEILEEKWTGEEFWLKASITINNKDLEQSLKQISEDEKTLLELEYLKAKLESATNEINKLKKQLAKDPSSANKQQEKYNTEVKILIASEFIYSAIEKLERKDHAGSIADFSQAIEVDPKNAELYFYRGFVKFDMEDFAGAISDFDQAIARNTAYFDSYYFRGIAKKSTEDYVGSLNDFTFLIEKAAPKYQDAYFYRGAIRNYFDDHRGAIDDLTKYNNLSSPHAESFYELGFAKHFLNDLDGAVQDLSKAIEINPNYIEALMFRGYSYLLLKDFAMAVPDFTKILQVDPYAGHAYYSRGLALLQMNEKISGCKDMRSAARYGEERAYEAIQRICK